MSRIVLSRGARAALALFALAVAHPAGARDILETPSALFFTRDQENGIQMARPNAGISALVQFFLPREHEFDDFEADSIRQFQSLAADIGREAARPRFDPFRATWLFDTKEDTYVIADRALGPLLAERPTTMGKGKLALGFSYRSLNYDRFNGTKLADLSARISHKDVPSSPTFVENPSQPFRNCDINPALDVNSPSFNPNDPRLASLELRNGFYPCGQELDYVDVAIDFKIEQDFVDFYLEYGMTDSWDVGIVLPLAQTVFEANATAFTRYGIDPAAQPSQAASWTEASSILSHSFCRELDSTSPIVLANPPGGNFNLPPGIVFACPNNPGDLSFGQRSAPNDNAGFPASGNVPGQSFRGPVRDTKSERAVGIGDIRIRSKLHALHSDGAFLPDLAWVSELKPPTGIEDDFQGTGALSASNYLVGAWHIWRFHPHFNAGVEISTGPAWQDAGEWILGVDAEVFEWLGISVDYLGRVPFDSEVADRHEIGGGVKMVITPGVALSFDALFPLNKNEGLTADINWRVGGQIQF